MSLVEGIMCHSIHYFTIVFNISLLQCVYLVSNVSLACMFYMLLPFDVGIIYFLDVNKCTHLVVEFIVLSLRFCYGALLSRVLEISAIKIYTGIWELALRYIVC